MSDHSFDLPEEGQPVWDRERALWAGVERGKAGQDYKTNTEDLLKGMLPDLADEHLMINQEGRGAFLLLLALEGGRALFLGDALSGTVSAMARLGFQVVSADAEPARLAFAKLRDEALAPGRVQHVQVARGGPFPFRNAQFDLVVLELGPHGEPPLWGQDPEAAWIYTRGFLVWVTDNALAYKRALGRRGKFEYQMPWRILWRALKPPAGEGTRGRLRRKLLENFAEVESVALYPHRLESSHVVHLENSQPALTVGPKERRNAVKVFAKNLGAFPWLAPSVAWIARRTARTQGGRDSRLQRALDELAERLGRSRQLPAHLIATRGNVAVVQTETEQGEFGWTLHVPLGAQKRRLVERHYRCLETVRTHHAAVPVPEPLFLGEFNGMWLSCEERLTGRHAPQLKEGSHAQWNMLNELAQVLPKLALGDPITLDGELFEKWIHERVRRVIRLAGRRATAQRIIRMVDEARDIMLGETFQPVLYHADLRPKHVQVHANGSLIGLMDWGASEGKFFPYLDMLHLVAHLYPRSARVQWEALTSGQLHGKEIEALNAYCDALGISPGLRRGLESLYPVFVAGMAERNWDFSRPYWVHREFGL